jgi:SAM-dependent methyltransferase
MNSDLTAKINEIQFPNEIDTIDSIMDGYKYYQMVSVALKLGIFEKMDELGSSSPREIAEAISLNGMFIKSILSTLKDMGFVKSDEEGYTLTKPAKSFFSKKSPFYQGDLILSVGKTGSQWNNLEALLQRKRSSKPISVETDENQIRSLAQQSIRGEVQSVIQGMLSRPEFLEYKYLLDIGGSHGLYSVGLCQENNALSATILEQEDIIPFTSSIVSEYDMNERIKVEKGSIENLSGDLSHGYDIIIVSHFLYKYRRELNEVLEKIVDMLNPGGTLILNHRFCSPNCEIKPGAGVREIDRALTSFGHPLCHPEGLKDVLESLGFVNISLIPHETALGYAVLCVGTKETKKIKQTSEEKVVHDYGENRCC